MAEFQPIVHRTHRSNALFNLLGGGFSMLILLVIPFLLNRWLSQADYASWVLGFQIAMYIPLLGFGIHQILMRSIARGFAEQSSMAIQKAIASGFFLICAQVLVGIAIVVLSVFTLPFFLNGSAVNLAVIEAVWLRVGIAASIGLAALFYFGSFGAIARFEWENMYKAIIAVMFIGLVCILHLTDELMLIHIAYAYFLAIFSGIVFLTLVFLKQKIMPRPTLQAIDKPLLRSFFVGMRGISVWQLSAFLVAGVDVWIIARIAFDAVPGYSLALALVTFFSGVGVAFLSPCLPRFTLELSKPGGGQFQGVFVHYQKRLLQIMGTLVALIFLVPNTIWVLLFQEATPVFLDVFPILLIAAFIRMLTVLYSIAIVSANLQHQVIAPPLAEGISNLAMSIVLGIWLGPMGVALGTLAGAMICFALYSVHTIPKCAGTLPLKALSLLLPWKPK
jgi:O-antigen/teichoic acid export membrane protein